MIARLLIEKANEAGITLIREPDGRLTAEGPAPAINELWPEIRQHKIDVLALLPANDAPDVVGLVGYGGFRPADPRVGLDQWTHPVDEPIAPDPDTHRRLWHPEGTRVEPLPDPSPDSPPPMTQAEEAAIRAWFAHIGETAPDLIAPYLDRCQGSLEARRYFLARAATDGAPIVQVDPPAQPAPSALVSCAACHHYRPNAHGWGGLGRCQADAPASREPGSLWPRSETRCRDFAPMEVTP